MEQHLRWKIIFIMIVFISSHVMVLFGKDESDKFSADNAQSYSEEDEEEVEVRDDLYRAVFVGDVNQVKYLINQDHDLLGSRAPVLVNRVEKYHGRTSLMVCAFDPQHEETWKVDSDCAEILRTLHEAGANLLHVDKHGWDALSLGAIRGFKKYCSYLIDNKVPINRLDHNNRTALIKAAAHAQLDTVKLLLQHNANYKLVDDRGMAAIHYGTVVAINNATYLSFLDGLLEAHPSDAIHLRDKDRRTPLMYAVISNNIPVTKVLLQHGADPRMTDAFQVATTQMTKDEELLQLLQDASIVLLEKEHMKWMETTQRQLEDALDAVDAMALYEV